MKKIYFLNKNKTLNTKSNNVNPFKGLPSYFIRKGKKQIIQKYFKFFFFQVLKDLLKENNKNVNLSDNFFQLYWRTLPLYELKLIDKSKNAENIELIRLNNNKFGKRKNKVKDNKNQIGFPDLTRSKETNLPILSNTSDRFGYKLIPLSTNTQNKLHKRWTFKYINTKNKNRNLSKNLYETFQKELIDSNNNLTKECLIGLKFFSVDLNKTIKNFKFFQNDEILADLIFDNIDKNILDSSVDLNKSNDFDKLMEKLFFNQLLNKNLMTNTTNINEISKIIDNNYMIFQKKRKIEKKLDNQVKKENEYILNSLNSFYLNKKSVLNNNFNKTENGFFFGEEASLNDLWINKTKKENDLEIKLILSSFDKFNLKNSIKDLKKKFNYMNVRVSHSFLPTKRKIYTLLSSPHVNKTARDQYVELLLL